MKQTEFAHAPSINIQMVREKEVFYNGNKVIQADNASEAFCALLGNPDREFFVAMLLDGQNRITGLHVVSQGSLNQSICHPRETFKAAILANSASVILAHNHPSGNLTPSSEDIQITRRMKEAGDILGIKVLDHVIVNTTDGSNYSFTNMGLM